MRTASNQETRDHYVAVRDILKRAGWDSHRIAGEIGVTRQTSYQYGFNPETRGARVIPADKLDKLRELATAAEAERHERGFPAFLPRAEHLWLVFGAGMELLLETTSPWRAVWHAARHCGVAMPGRDNAQHRDRQLTADDELCVEWMEHRHGGLITKADVMEVAAVDEYLVERVGHEHHGWRIQPTAEQVEALKELHLSRWSHAA